MKKGDTKIIKWFRRHGKTFFELIQRADNYLVANTNKMVYPSFMIFVIYRYVTWPKSGSNLHSADGLQNQKSREHISITHIITLSAVDVKHQNNEEEVKEGCYKWRVHQQSSQKKNSCMSITKM